MASFLSVLLLAYVSVQQALWGVLLGVVQGISEWLPVSSKTQIIVVATYLLKLSFNEAYSFGLFMEIGTILAAVIYFRRELLALLRYVVGKGEAGTGPLFRYVLVSTVVTGIVGAPLYLFVDSIQGKYNLGIPMLILGMVLILDALFIRYSRSNYARKSNSKKLSNLSLRDCALIGVAQGVAALPGVSRSGITTSSLLLMDVESDEAFRLSFLNSVFATTAAVGLTLIASRHNVAAAVGAVGIPGLLIAIAVSTVVSLLLIDFLLKMSRRSGIVYLTAALGVIAIFGGAVAAITNVGG